MEERKVLDAEDNSNPSLIEANNVGVSFGTHGQALKGITFGVRRSEFVAILGPFEVMQLGDTDRW
jgi:ABC-type multidrug transport system fused ATPase/permease subunit